MGIVRCCWKRWWTRRAFVAPAIGLPTGSMWGRPPGAGAWTGSTKASVKPSKTSTSIRWFAIPASIYAAIRLGKQTLLVFLARDAEQGVLRYANAGVTKNEQADEILQFVR